MQTFYFTFHQYHTHEKINMQNYFVKVIAESEQIAKEVTGIIYRDNYAKCSDQIPTDKTLFETVKQRLTNQ